VFDEQVNRIVPNLDPTVMNDDAMLLRDRQPSLPKLVQQSALNDFLQEVGSLWRTVRAQPMIRLGRRLTLSPVSICVFSVFCGSIIFVYWRHNLPNPLTPDLAAPE
jgi:hypothetical protein